jgi:exopolysaccharide production protein ExoZ
MSSIAALRQHISRTAQDWFESPNGGARLLPMEGLRGLAVLLVFFVHAHVFFGPYVASHPRLFAISEYLGRVGNVGVDLFFVLSGFIIYSALVHKPVTYFSFLRRRVKRIYPTFLAVLSSYLLLSMVFPSENKIPVRTWAAAKYILENVLLMPGFFRIVPIVTVAWSLSLEFAFYLCVPLVVFILGRDRQHNLRRIALLSVMWTMFSVSEALFFQGRHIRMLSFLSGMLLQEITASGKLRAYLSRSGQWLSVLALALITSYHFAVQPKNLPTRGSGVLSVALMSVATFFLVLYSLEYRGALHKVCTWKPMRYWGNISYSYYLAHGVTLKGMALLLTRLRPQPYPVFIYFAALAAGLIVTWASAGLLYLFVEKPMSLTCERQDADIRGTALTAFPWWLRRSRAGAETSGNL